MRNSIRRIVYEDKVRKQIRRQFMTICCNASVLLTPCAIWNYMAQYVKMDDVVYKQEVDNVLHCRQKKTEPRSKTRCTGNSEKFSQVVFDTCEQTRQSKYFAPFPEAKLTLNDATLRAVGRNLRAVHRHAARCCAALLKTQEAFYQRSAATRSGCVNGPLQTNCAKSGSKYRSCSL